MKNTRTKLALIVAVAMLMFTAPLFYAFADNADEEKEVKAPEAVLAAFHKAYPTAKILKVFIETKNKVAYYEIESLDNSVGRDLLYFPDGSVFEVEEQIAISLLPAKVLASIKAKYPMGVIKEAEKITRPDSTNSDIHNDIHNGIVEYGIILEDGEKDLELVLTPNGSIESQVLESDNDEISETSDTEAAEDTAEANEGDEED